jgi:hypothetical protein
MNGKKLLPSGVVLAILIMSLLSGCSGKDAGSGGAGATGEVNQPPVQYKAGLISYKLRTGWNLLTFNRPSSQKFTSVVMTFNGETRALKDAAPEWTQSVIRFLKGRAFVLLQTGSASASFQPGGKYYVYSSRNGVMLVLNQPIISSINPSAGIPGDSVTIMGANFGSAGSVIFSDQVQASEIVSWEDGRIICRVPSGASTGAIRVQNAVGQSNLSGTFLVPIVGDLYVNGSSGSDLDDGSYARPLKTVSHALGQAVQGDLILVAEGTYDGAGGETFPIQFPSGIKLRGGFNSLFTEWNPGARPTILDAGQAARVMSFTLSGTDTELEGFTIRNGSAVGANGAPGVAGDPGLGGGLYILNGSPAIRRCVISGNGARGGDGGAAYTAGNGGAALGGGVYSEGGSPVLSECTISNNTLTAGSGGYCTANLWNKGTAGTGGAARGGGFYGTGGSPSLVSCTIDGNISTAGAGGKGDEDGASGEERGASYGGVGGTAQGGGIYHGATSLTVTSCRIINNRLTSGDGGRGGQWTGSAESGDTTGGPAGIAQGAGLFTVGGTVANCLAGNNVLTGGKGGNAGVYGRGGNGGAAQGSGLFLSGGVLLVSGCTLAGNSATGGNGGTRGAVGGPAGSGGDAQGGGLYGPTAVFHNSILYANTLTGGTGAQEAPGGAAQGGGFFNFGGAPAFLYSSLYGNTPDAAYKNGSGGIGDFPAWGWDGTSCQDADPLFVDAASKNYRLQGGSPCVDAGSNGLIPGGITTDLEGNPRIVNLIVDLGAYEKQ